MVNDPWAASGSRPVGDDPLEQTAAPTAQDPWATQEQPTVPASVESFAPPAPAYLPPPPPPVAVLPADDATETTADATSPFLEPGPASPAAPSLPGAVPPSAEGPLDLAVLAQELASSPAAAEPTRPAIPDFVVVAGGSAAPIPPAAPVPPVGLTPPSAPVPPRPTMPSNETATLTVAPGAYEVPATVERTAVPMPDLETTSSSESTIAVGRYGTYGFVIRFADGQGHPVDRPVVFGRRPDPGHGPGDARLVTIDDPQRTVSRSHLLAMPGRDGILLRNLSTVNALVLVSPEGDEAEVEPGGAITVTGPCRVILGAYPVAVERA